MPTLKREKFKVTHSKNVLAPTATDAKKSLDQEPNRPHLNRQSKANFLHAIEKTSSNRRVGMVWRIMRDEDRHQMKEQERVHASSRMPHASKEQSKANFLYATEKNRPTRRVAVSPGCQGATMHDGGILASNPSTGIPHASKKTKQSQFPVCD
jgi:hypothetical protein